MLGGLWAGNGGSGNTALIPSTRPDGGAICKGMTLTRTGAGLYTLQLAASPGAGPSVPFILGLLGNDIGSPTGVVYTISEVVRTASTGTMTLKITVAGTLTDPATTETIWICLAVADAGQP